MDAVLASEAVSRRIGQGLASLHLTLPADVCKWTELLFPSPNCVIDGLGCFPCKCLDRLWFVLLAGFGNRISTESGHGLKPAGSGMTCFNLNMKAWYIDLAHTIFSVF